MQLQRSYFGKMRLKRTATFSQFFLEEQNIKQPFLGAHSVTKPAKWSGSDFETAALYYKIKINL